MAEIIQEEKQEKGQRKKPKKHSTHIDMTPMVDLMCLLITFFMLTTAFSKPKVMEITMPEKSDKTSEGPKINKDRVINILMSGDDKLYWYPGLADPKTPPLPELIKTDYSKDGIRKVLLNKNKNVFKQVEELKQKVLKGDLLMADSTLNRKIKEIKKSDKGSPIVLIKADEKAKYKNIVDIIDEMAICNIASYAVVDISDVELGMIDAAK
ncbi:MAG TPA: biopolymer transporter ExbD [Bacteroidales bacterium]|nr:biopolymer transporter ExbD [Bacteroidales bacterium]HPS17465.1 biopolymer transporter ExbD [Bacteroidales bacterium]